MLITLSAYSGDETIAVHAGEDPIPAARRCEEMGHDPERFDEHVQARRAAPRSRRSVGLGDRPAVRGGGRDQLRRRSERDAVKPADAAAGAGCRAITPRPAPAAGIDSRASRSHTPPRIPSLPRGLTDAPVARPLPV